TYSLIEGPTDATLDTVSGLLNWTPSAAGYFKFKLKVQSNLGGKAYQEWTVKVIGPTGTIAGTVVDESTNQPLEHVAVYFINTNSTRYEHTYTNSNGEFSKSLVEGNYKIKFYKRGYYPEFYDNKSSIDSADIVSVVANTTVTISASLASVPPPVQYTISGSVLDSNGLPIRSVVTAFFVRDTTFPIIHPHHFPRYMFTITDSNGNYQLRVLGGFEYVVFAKPFNRNYYPEFYDNKRTFNEADRILVNSDVSGINFVLEQKPVYNNGISGVVKDFVSGSSVEAIVSAFKLTNGRFKPFKSIKTDSLGNYLIENLQPGNYIVFARPRLPYLPGYYKADTVALRWREADTVIVSESGVVTGIDINLITRPDTGFARINGKVRTILGEPVSGALIFAYDLNGNVNSYTISESDGSYSLENLSAGEFTLIVESTEYENTADNGTVNVDYGSNSTAYKDLYLSPASTTGVGNQSTTPTSYSLMQNYPNPFNPTTTIRFTIPEKVHVKLEVYNLIGQKIATLINGELNAGQYNFDFNGAGLSSGIYLYRIQAGNFTSVKKMLLLK
ncbi:MAG: carboxypeptidase regulatory-like domain-containing protein, partial [Ignavibacteria bacterium]